MKHNKETEVKSLKSNSIKNNTENILSHDFLQGLVFSDTEKQENEKSFNSSFESDSSFYNDLIYFKDKGEECQKNLEKKIEQKKFIFLTLELSHQFTIEQPDFNKATPTLNPKEILKQKFSIHRSNTSKIENKIGFFNEDYLKTTNSKFECIQKNFFTIEKQIFIDFIKQKFINNEIENELINEFFIKICTENKKNGYSFLKILDSIISYSRIQRLKKINNKIMADKNLISNFRKNKIMVNLPTLFNQFIFNEEETMNNEVDEDYSKLFLKLFEKIEELKEKLEKEKEIRADSKSKKPSEINFELSAFELELSSKINKLEKEKINFILKNEEFSIIKKNTKSETNLVSITEKLKYENESLKKMNLKLKKSLETASKEFLLLKKVVEKNYLSSSSSLNRSKNKELKENGLIENKLNLLMNHSFSFSFIPSTPIFSNYSDSNLKFNVKEKEDKQEKVKRIKNNIFLIKQEIQQVINTINKGEREEIHNSKNIIEKKKKGLSFFNSFFNKQKSLTTSFTHNQTLNNSFHSNNTAQKNLIEKILCLIDEIVESIQ